MANTTVQKLQAKIASERWALLPLRLLLGFGFAFHGYAKLARGVGKFAVVLADIGAPMPVPLAWATTLIEFFGGISLMLGAFVVPLSVPLIVIMLTAMIGVHLPYGFSSVALKGITPAGATFGPVGYEVNLLYIVGLVTLATGGPSPLSLGPWLRARVFKSKG